MPGTAVERLCAPARDADPGQGDSRDAALAARVYPGASMNVASLRLQTADLARLAGATLSPPCPLCVGISAPGWESIPGGFDRGALRPVGTLRQPDEEEPTLLEHHPAGTNAWSPDAPIAAGFFPYNRCEVWACAGCDRPFLRYTEYGGYYIEERIRPLDPALIVNP